MDQLELFPLENLCVGVCESNNKGYCKGCFRRRDERQSWLTMTNLQKRSVMRLCYFRRRKSMLSTQYSGSIMPKQKEFDL